MPAPASRLFSKSKKSSFEGLLRFHQYRIGGNIGSVGPIKIDDFHKIVVPPREQYCSEMHCADDPKSSCPLSSSKPIFDAPASAHC
jgi:hypothetical protein